jgi:hypothetical protein
MSKLKGIATVDIPVATETWIATALLHREHPERDDFTIQEIIARVQAENLTGSLRPGVGVHASTHCVANREPRPARHRMLYATGKRTRRLFREGDEADLQRTGRITPEPESIPARYRYLLDWYSNEYSKLANQPPQGAWLRGVMELAGSGREIFAGIDPDGYVHKLRKGWQ